MSHLRSVKRGVDRIELPKGGVIALCALVLALPAGFALAHSPYLDSQGRWIHHHTTAYTTCNGIDQSTALRDQATNARQNWMSLSQTANGSTYGLELVSLPNQSDCHPGSGNQAEIQLIDAYFGNTGWRASSLNDQNSWTNAAYHPAHTHINFNLTPSWSAYTNYDRRALVCREIGRVIGVNQVWSSQWASHGQQNDCMSFAANPDTQVSREENQNNYTYTDRPGVHSRDLLDPLYADHVPLPDTALTGGPAAVTNQADAVFQVSGENASSFQCRTGRDSTTMSVWSSCGTTYSLTSLPEGQHRVEARGVNQAGVPDSTPAAREFIVDTSPPTVEPLAGSLVQSAAFVDADTTYELVLAAADGDVAAPASRRSGVERLEVFANGEQDPRYVVEVDCTQANRSCRLDSSATSDAVWTIPLDEFVPGQNTLRVVATDGVGNASPANGVELEIDAEDLNTPVPMVDYCAAPESEDTADELLDQVSLEMLDSIALEVFGPDFGGVWIERSVCPSTVQVGVVDPQSADTVAFEEALLAEPTVAADRVEVSSVPLTQDQMDAAADAAGEILANQTTGEYGVGYSYPDPSIEVSAPVLSSAQRDAVSAAVDSALPSGNSFPRGTPSAVDFATGDDWEDLELAHGSRLEFPPYEAGILLSGARLCTAGFTLRRERDLFISSAGHCQISGGSLEDFGDEFMGTVLRTALDDLAPARTTDALLATLNNDESTRRVYTGGTGHRAVSGRIRNFPNGRVLCFQGRVSQNNNCGPIYRHRREVRLDASPFGDLIVKNTVCIREPGAQGDSGGPVYDVQRDGSARAAGLVGYLVRTQNSNVCFARMGSVTDYLDARLAVRGN